MIRRFGYSPDRWSRMALRASLVAITLACLLLTARTLSAQAVAGMTGTITDTTGAVIPNAQVTITNVNTGVTNHSITSSAGTYTVRGLIPGTYSLTVEAAGFQKSVQRGILVEVSTVATINATLQLGSTTETVSVTANPVALNTTQPQIGTTLEHAVVTSLPFEVAGRGRQIDQVQFLAPGVTGDTFSHRVDGGVDFEQEILYNGIPAMLP